MILSKEARLVTLFGKIYSSVEIDTITGESTPFLAEETFAALMSLADEDKKPVKIIINNRGGSMIAAALIIDAIEHLQARGIEVTMLVVGSSMGVSTAILASGTRGRRFALKRAAINLGPITVPNLKDLDPGDVALFRKQHDVICERLYEVLALKTLIPECRIRDADPALLARLDDEEFRKKQVKAYLKTDVFLSPEEAAQVGILDEVLLPGDPLVDEIFHIPQRVREFGFGNKEVSK
jgi:ATP-dependent protease ClpP protease subunit